MTFVHLDDVLAEVGVLGRMFGDAKYRIFIVGGIVRDQWLDHSLDASSDIDLTTDAYPPAIKDIVRDFAEDMWTQGERFGTIGLRARGRDFEITTHRAEEYDRDSRKPQVSFGDNIEVDLSRRDFTVNAMAIELPDGELVDPFGGADDLRDGILRTPLDADVSFSDDPLRMLRAARFATKYSLRPTDEVVRSATDLHERLRIVAIERIGVEMRRLLALDDPTVGLAFLADTGLLAEVLAYGEPDRLDSIQPRLNDGLAVVSRLGTGAPWELRLAALGHSLFNDSEGVSSMAQRLRLSQQEWRKLVRTCQLADVVIDHAPGDDPVIRRWVMSDRDSNREAALDLARALRPSADEVERFADRYASMAEVADFAAVTFIDGETIMDALQIEAGPEIGRALTHLHECYFAYGPMTDAQQIEALQEWASQQ